MQCIRVMPTLGTRHHLLGVVQAVAGALREREAALLTVQCIDEDMAKKKKSVEQLEEQGALLSAWAIVTRVALGHAVLHASTSTMCNLCS